MGGILAETAEAAEPNTSYTPCACRSSDGLSKSSLTLETTSLSLTACYFCANGYPVADYFEYPVLIAQNIALFAIVFFFEAKNNLILPLATLAGYGVAVYAFAARVLPMIVIQTASVSE